MGEARSSPPSLADPTNVRGVVLTPRPRPLDGPPAEAATELLFLAAAPLFALFIMPGCSSSFDLADAAVPHRRRCPPDEPMKVVWTLRCFYYRSGHRKWIDPLAFTLLPRSMHDINLILTRKFLPMLLCWPMF